MGVLRDIMGKAYGRDYPLPVENVGDSGGRSELYGKSTDTKPTNVEIGSTFYEIDTGDIYMFDNTDWVIQ